ncbi:hypothetical protein [Christiangramia salexigens]|uniref:Uncharacterized protein n=1 Tax=Christiangramia salexigens TaxID=1913577 RepID=A0A1L3J448_9FLAO|nr:hypothetical protein [Christiangramia salexigens]APG59919.1 hypothetical protein LPB144_05610 [Christiangramia salexigens]
MKKILVFFLIIIVVFIGLVYLSVRGNDKEFETCKILNIEDVENIDFHDYDSVLVAANNLYKGGMVKELMQGSNYREAWSTPVKVPVVFLDTLKGGMKILEEGGGKQTHSLKLESKDKITYTLRSITKDPKKLIPDIAKTLGLENIIVDGVSAQHPYGAILAAKLADIAGVLHTHPRVVFIPKQERLGEFNDKYGNRLYLLEFETESEENWTDFPDVKEIIETDDLQELRQKYGQKVSINRSALVRIRLFDLLIGDWDRHSEQWGWIIQKENDNFVATPIAGDRDNAFFNPDGVIPSIVTNKNVKPLIRPFEKDIDHMKGLVYPFDIYFLYNTPERIFIEQANNLQDLMTDEKIDEAFAVWPKEIRDLNQSEISAKIKARRDKLVKYARSFHQVIENSELLKEPLKGSDDLDLEPGLLKCFECE